MTYCLGWKSKTAAFLIADSAVTSITEDKGNISLLEKPHLMNYKEVLIKVKSMFTRKLLNYIPLIM